MKKERELHVKDWTRKRENWVMQQLKQLQITPENVETSVG